MADIQLLLKLGKELDLSGQELRDWVVRKAAEQEEERAAQIARDERADQIARDERAAERELRKLELEAQIAKASSKDSPGSQNSAPKIKLPPFDDRIDEIDAYILRFEVHAQKYWPRAEWGTYFISLLRGRALTYFGELSPEDTLDYDRVKDLMLKRFAHTEDVLRGKFRSARPDLREDFSAFVARLCAYFDKWCDLAGVKDFSQLRDLMIRDQIYGSCHKDLIIFLQERKPSSLEELKSLAERYRVAHPNKPLARSAIVESQWVGTTEHVHAKTRNHSQTHNDFTHRTQNRHAGSNSSEPRSNNRSGEFRGGASQRAFDSVKKDVSCFRCGEKGHIARSCMHPPLCRNCGKHGHISDDCRIQSVAVTVSNELSLARPVSTVSRIHNQAVTSPITHCGTSSVSSSSVAGQLHVVPGFIADKPVSVLRDSGATVVRVHKDYVSDADLTGRTIPCYQFSGKVEDMPVARIQIDTPFLSGFVDAVVGSFPGAGLIVGNVPGVLSPSADEMANWGASRHADQLGAVQTRAMSKRSEPKPLKVQSVPFDITPEELKSLQGQDPSLKLCFEDAQTEKVKCFKFASSRYLLQDGLLYREYKKGSHSQNQLVVPARLVPCVLRLAHDIPVAGHMGVARTKEKVLQSFYWPSVNADVKLYCRSCVICQKTVAKGRTPRAPLQHIPVVSEPFQKIAIDLVGPIAPATERGNRFILTIVDSATRWPEAIPLRSITSTSVAEALFGAFSRVGLPRQILSDRGAQFTSELMRELFRLFGIDPITTTPYHPQSNGMCERLNGTLKTMLRKVAEERPRDWDRYIPAVLFAYREVRHESTGYRPCGYGALHQRGVKNDTHRLPVARETV